MDFLSDILLAAAAVGAAVYCLLLSRKLQRLTTLDGSLGQAIAVLSRQVDELTQALGKAQSAAAQTGTTLGAQTKRADQAIRKLELLLASLHDLPDSAPPHAAPEAAPVAARPSRAPSAWPTDTARPTPSFPEEPRQKRRLIRRRSEQEGLQ